MSCVVIDAGNTSTSIGRVAVGRVTHMTHVRGGLRAAPRACELALRRAAEDASVEGAILASVTPAVNARWQRLVRRVLNFDLILVDHRLDLNVRIDYPKPACIGADRIANACGGVVRYGAPLIVADFGTALTFDVVSRERAYIGGVIAPGLPLMIDYLHEKTALLPHIKLGGACPAVGRSTEGAMRIGARIGYRGIVRETVNYLRKSVGEDAVLCATGGYARWALQGIDIAFKHAPRLTLFGLGCIFERNRRA